MIARFAVAAAAALMLAACGDGASNSGTDSPPPSPLFYEIASASGETEGWLLGTIHALPDGVDWRTGPIDTALAEADLLVVEVANLGDADNHARLFNRLASAPQQPPIASKVAPELRGQLNEMLAAGDIEETRLATIDTWAAAISLAHVARFGDSSNGVERTLIAEFARRPIEQLESVEHQLMLFDSLPEQDQRDMLAAVVENYPQARSDPGRLARLWQAGDEAGIAAETKRGILADPELYEVLLAGRNREWIERIVPMLGAAPRPLIAVGAAHIVGPDGLPALLAARGYTLRRI